MESRQLTTILSYLLRAPPGTNLASCPILFTMSLIDVCQMGTHGFGLGHRPSRCTRPFGALISGLPRPLRQCTHPRATISTDRFLYPPRSSFLLLLVPVASSRHPTASIQTIMMGRPILKKDSLVVRIRSNPREKQKFRRNGALGFSSGFFSATDSDREERVNCERS